MKTLLIALTVLVSTQTFAATCKLAGIVGGGFNCYLITTKLNVETVQECAELAKATQENRFFNQIEKKEFIVSTKFTYKDKASNLTVKKRYEFEDQEKHCY